jgi:hypothetical protein
VCVCVCSPLSPADRLCSTGWLQMHANLISSMPEVMFWMNYFYRVEMLRRQLDFEPLAGRVLCCCEQQETTESPATSGGFVKVGRTAEEEKKKEEDDFDDLDDLGDLDGVDGDLLDAELEAQIAAEIGDDF